MIDVYDDLYQEVFIKQKLAFVDPEDLFKRIKDIRLTYINLPLGTKRLYKWYFFYQLSVINYDFKNACWEYIVCNDAELLYRYTNLINEYLTFQQKKKKVIRANMQFDQNDNL